MKKTEKKPRIKAATAKGPKPPKKAWAYMIGDQGPFGIDHAKAHAKAAGKDITNAKHLKALFMSKVEAKPGEKCAATGAALIPGEPDGAPAAVNETPHINRKQFDKQMRRGLEGTDQELAIGELAAADTDLKKQTASSQEVVAELKKGINVAKKRLEDALQVVTHGRLEVVRVEEVKDFKAGTYRLIRLEDGVILEDRALTDEDGQPELGLNAESPASAAPTEGADLPALDGTVGGDLDPNRANPHEFELDEDAPKTTKH